MVCHRMVWYDMVWCGMVFQCEEEGQERVV